MKKVLMVLMMQLVHFKNIGDEDIKLKKAKKYQNEYKLDNSEVKIRKI